MQKADWIEWLLLLGGIIFSICTLAGSGYVLLSETKVSAGYAVIPMVFTLAFMSNYQRRKKDRLEGKK